MQRRITVLTQALSPEHKTLGVAHQMHRYPGGERWDLLHRDGEVSMNAFRKPLVAMLCSYLVVATVAGGSAYAEEPAPQTPVRSSQPTPQELQQLVAPIALYPDFLVSQILAALTYPAQIVTTDRWLQAHPELNE